MAAEEWNKENPVGTLVRYYPIAGEPDFELTETRSEAWALGHGAVVVKVKGRTGGVLVSHCWPLAAIDAEAGR